MCLQNLDLISRKISATKVVSQRLEFCEYSDKVVFIRGELVIERVFMSTVERF